MRNKYLRLFTRSQDHDARIIYKKVNRLIFHTGFFLIFFLYSYFVLIVYLYFCFVFIFIAWRYICLFCDCSCFKKICQSHPTESFNQYRISFFEKVKSSMLMTSVLIHFYIFTYFLTRICPHILYFSYHIKTAFSCLQKKNITRLKSIYWLFGPVNTVTSMIASEMAV